MENINPGFRLAMGCESYQQTADLRDAVAEIDHYETNFSLNNQEHYDRNLSMMCSSMDSQVRPNISQYPISKPFLAKHKYDFFHAHQPSKLANNLNFDNKRLCYMPQPNSSCKSRSTSVSILSFPKTKVKGRSKSLSKNYVQGSLPNQPTCCSPGPDPLINSYKQEIDQTQVDNLLTKKNKRKNIIQVIKKKINSVFDNLNFNKIDGSSTAQENINVINGNLESPTSSNSSQEEPSSAIYDRGQKTLNEANSCAFSHTQSLRSKYTVCPVDKQNYPYQEDSLTGKEWPVEPNGIESKEISHDVAVENFGNRFNHETTSPTNHVSSSSHNNASNTYNLQVSSSLQFESLHSKSQTDTTFDKILCANLNASNNCVNNSIIKQLNSDLLSIERIAEKTEGNKIQRKDANSQIPATEIANINLQQLGLGAAPFIEFEGGHNRGLARELRELAKYGWYWGPLSRTEAEEKLADQSDGSFLVRDSSDAKYLLSLSFQSFGKTLHTRIEHSNGWFSFYPQPDHDGHRSLVELIEHCISKSMMVCFATQDLL